MPDTFTETTSESWFGRIGDAFKGVIIGFLLFLIAFPLLFWNEGRAVKRHKTLKEGGGAVVSIDSEAVDAGNEGRLVHVTGRADTTDALTDPVFGVSTVALKLQRTVEMYQWEERADSTTKKKTGGGTETTTTYTYQKVWAPHEINSSTFKDPEGHQNPGRMAHATKGWTANEVTLGAFVLTPSLVGRIDRYSPVEAPSPEAVPEAIQGEGQPYAGGFYVGRDPAEPMVGDLQVTFRAVAPTDVSIIARQIGNTFEPFLASTGGEIELLQTGTHSSEAMIEQAQASNKATTWLLRAIGFVLMLVGLNMVFRPLSVLADVVPFIGRLVGAGTGLIAFLAALACSTVTMAIAWLVYRPLLGIGLLVMAAVITIVAVRTLKKQSPAPVAPGANPA